MSLPENKIKDGWAHYHADVEWRTSREVIGLLPNIVGRRKFTTVVVHAASADHALRQVHSTMQKSKESDTERRIMRPMLAPGEYVITRLFIPYKDASGDNYERTFDLPKSDNPDLSPPESAVPAAQATIDLILDEAKGVGKLSS